jgi:hypothetical protein
MGLEDDEREVLIQKNKAQARYVRGQWRWLWYGLFGQLVAYGYKPWRAFILSLFFIAIGWIAFRTGYDGKIMTPTGSGQYAAEIQRKAIVAKDQQRSVSDDYPKFNAFAYSVETFVPLLKLGIAERWTPNAHRTAMLKFGLVTWVLPGSYLRYYLWFHIIAGWVLTSLWVGALTGLVKT